MREAYNDPKSMKEMLVAPTEANFKKIMRGFGDGVSIAERTSFKKRIKALMAATIGTATLLCLDMSAACLFSANISLDIDLNQPNVIAAVALFSLLLLFLFALVANTIVGRPIANDNDGGNEWSRQIRQADNDRMDAERRRDSLHPSEDGSSAEVTPDDFAEEERRSSSSADEDGNMRVLSALDVADVDAAPPHGASNRVHPGNGGHV